MVIGKRERSAAMATIRVLPRGRATPSDAELLSGLRRGDGRIAAALWSELAPTIERTICRTLGRRATDHDDLVQVTFERLVRTVADDKYSGECSLRSFASLLAARVAIDALRTHYRERRLFDQVERDAIGGDPEARLDARAELVRVRLTLATLTEERAAVLWMHDALGHELKEIALILGISVSAAQSRLVRGRAQLLERLRKGETPREVST